MLVTICRSKIRDGRVTAREITYEGSITIDSEIIAAAGMIPGEMVHVLNLNNGARIMTYVIEGPGGSGKICLNGAAARFFEIGDEIIILATALVTEEEARATHLKIVRLGEKNRLRDTGAHPETA